MPFCFEDRLRSKNINEQVIHPSINLLISESVDTDAKCFYQFGIPFLVSFCSTLMPIRAITFYDYIVVCQKEINRTLPKWFFPLIRYTHGLQTVLYNCLNISSPLTSDLSPNRPPVRVILLMAYTRAKFPRATRMSSSLKLFATIQTRIRLLWALIIRVGLTRLSFSFCSFLCLLSTCLRAMNDFRLTWSLIKWFFAISANSIFYATFMWPIALLTALLTLWTESTLLATKELWSQGKLFLALRATFIKSTIYHPSHYCFSRLVFSRYFCKAHTSSPLNERWFSCALLRKASMISGGTWTVIFSFVEFLFIPVFYHKNTGMSTTYAST